MNTRTVLVAHDFSSYAENAADAALDDLIDSTVGGRMVLVHCFHFVPLPGFELAPLGDTLLNAEINLRKDAARTLEHIVERLRKRARFLSVDAEIEIEGVVRIGTAVDGLLEEARARDANRIFIGTHGRSGLNHFLLGSVAERVARMAHVPVVVVHGTRADAQGGRDAATSNG